MLPGTVRAAGRFARASYCINACMQSADAREAVAAVFSVMRNVSVPRGVRKKDAPNLSSTIWRTVTSLATSRSKKPSLQRAVSPAIATNAVSAA
jgi:penicillin V acylase-like amidase (Ntn superfamily)